MRIGAHRSAEERTGAHRSAQERTGAQKSVMCEMPITFLWLKPQPFLRLKPPDSTKMVLYVFEVRGAAFVKVGFTAGCPWGRVRDDFWRVVHPKACCNRLGWDSLELLGLFPGIWRTKLGCGHAFRPSAANSGPWSACRNCAARSRTWPCLDGRAILLTLILF